jgi:hypothetical protein
MGRPKGSKNRIKEPEAIVPKRRGRPKGSKNKPKEERKLAILVPDFWKCRGRYGKTKMRQAEREQDGSQV